MQWRPELASVILAARTDERRRIARELHDDTMQSMAALIIELERSLQSVTDETTDHPQVRQALRAVAWSRDLAVRMLDDLRRLAQDLRPSLLDQGSLVPALRALADQESARTGIPIALELGGSFATGDSTPAGTLPEAIEKALLRIAQEAIANVGKHSRATRATIRLGGSPAQLTLEIEDNGIGVPEGTATRTAASAAAGEREHMGLRNMRERATLLGGRCRIGRGPRGGTVVRAELPLPSIGGLVNELRQTRDGSRDGSRDGTREPVRRRGGVGRPVRQPRWSIRHQPWETARTGTAVAPSTPTPAARAGTWSIPVA